MTNLVTYDPFVDTGFDELFRGFFEPVRMEGARAPITIKMDVTETGDGYMIHAEIPGVKKEWWYHGPSGNASNWRSGRPRTGRARLPGTAEPVRPRSTRTDAEVRRSSARDRGSS